MCIRHPLHDLADMRYEEADIYIPNSAINTLIVCNNNEKSRFLFRSRHLHKIAGLDYWIRFNL